MPSAVRDVAEGLLTYADAVAAELKALREDIDAAELHIAALHADDTPTAG